MCTSGIIREYFKLCRSTYKIFQDDAFNQRIFLTEIKSTLRENDKEFKRGNEKLIKTAIGDLARVRNLLSSRLVQIKSYGDGKSAYNINRPELFDRLHDGSINTDNFECADDPPKK